MRISIISLLVGLLSIVSAQAQPYCSKYKTVTSTNRLMIEDHRSDSMDIVHTRLDLDLRDVANKQIEGIAKIKLNSKVGSNSYVRFDFEGLTADSVNGAMVSGYSQSDTTLLVEFSSPLSLGQQTEIEIYYHGSPMKDASGWGGFYFSGDYSWNLGVGFADDPHSYGRIWFPCYDNFIERSTMEFYVRVKSDRRASCNGVLQGVTNNGDTTDTYHWKLDQTIPSYLACVAVAPYTIVEGTIACLNGPIPYQIHAKSSDSNKVVNSFTHLDEAVQAFEAAYGKYRFDKVGYSLVPFNSGAMEHATNIAYPISASNGSLAQESLMSHELAHMWWGDNITCQTDGDMWINEGWASFSEYVFEEAVYGRKAYEDAMKEDLRYMLQKGHHEEGGYRAVSGQPHEYVYGDHVYKKGALVAHNLRGYMGDEAFYSTCAQFMEKFKYSPVSSDSLEKYFSQFSGMDLSSFFRDWVFRPGYNVVVLDSFSAKSGGSIDLHLQQKLKGTSDYHDGVPVYYTVYDQNWNSESGQTSMSGQYEMKTISSSLTPAMIVLYDKNEQAQARTVDRVVVSESGALTLPNFFWSNVDVTSVSDSALVYFEHIWAAPDAIKDFYNLPYRLSTYHYWRVTGLGLDKVELKGKFNYDGKASGPGYLDMDLVSVQEDSLLLLYRMDAYDDWREYEFYSKNDFTLNDDGFGLMELTKLLPGEYTLANVDHTVLGSEEIGLEPQMSLYPNPAKGYVLIRLENSYTDDVKAIQILDIQGKTVLESELAGDHATISTSDLPNGTYICRLKSSTGTISRKFVVEQ